MKKLNQAGMTLVEVLIVVALLGAAALGMADLFKNQQAQTAKIELLYKSEQLRSVLGSQFLDSNDMCKCLFDGAANFSNTGAPVLSGVSPSSIGRYDFAIPGNCATATIGKVFIDTAGIDQLKLISVELRDIAPISGSYFGELQVKVNSSKKVTGVNQQFLKIPVRISSSDASAGMQQFEGCSLASNSGSSIVSSDPTANGHMTFANGLTFQWGEKTIPKNKLRTFSFNKPFTTDVYTVIVNGTESSKGNSQDNNPTAYKPWTATKNTFQVMNARGQQTTFSWFAIGK